jgi:magnesium chelatase family protein
MTFPARVTLVGAMNPCPCGFLSDPRRSCCCSKLAVERYQRRLSGPLRDRFDLTVDVQPVQWAELHTACAAESSALVKTRVVDARERQLARQGVLNAQLEGSALHRATTISTRSHRLLGQAVTRLGLSARAVTRVLRVARTIGDLAGADRIDDNHVAEALHFRVADASQQT